MWLLQERPVVDTSSQSAYMPGSILKSSVEGGSPAQQVAAWAFPGCGCKG